MIKYKRNILVPVLILMLAVCISGCRKSDEKDSITKDNTTESTTYIIDDETTPEQETDAPKPVSESEVSVLTYNLLSAMASVDNAQKVMDAVTENHYDVCAFEEVVQVWKDSLEQVTQNTSYRFTAVGQDEYAGLGIGVLYNTDTLELLDQTSTALSGGNSYDGYGTVRYCMVSHFRTVADGTEFYFISLHLEWADIVQNAQQGQYIYDMAVELLNQGYPVIAAGDFNNIMRYYVSQNIFTADGLFTGTWEDGTYVGMQNTEVGSNGSFDTNSGFAPMVNSLVGAMQKGGITVESGNTTNTYPVDCEEAIEYYEEHRDEVDAGDETALSELGMILLTAGRAGSIDNILYSNELIAMESSGSGAVYEKGSDHNGVWGTYKIYNY